MIRTTRWVFILTSIAVGLLGCSSGQKMATTGAITLNGMVTTGTGSISASHDVSLDKAAPSGCPDDSSGGIAINASPSDNTVTIATQYVRILKQGSDDYLELASCDYATAQEAEAAAIALGVTSATMCQLNVPLNATMIGTYDGMEMAIYYIEMTVPLIVPQIVATRANYRLRVYFNNDDASGILARDVLIFDTNRGQWGWVNWDDMTQLTYTDEPRPSNLLDAFANDLFWCADCDTDPSSCTSARQCSADHPTWQYKNPVVISSRDDSGGTNFSMTNTFSIMSISDEQTLTMSFDIADTLTAWASQAQIDAGQTSVIDVSQSCGFHPLFPSVTITTN